MQAAERYRCRRNLERSIREAGHGARVLSQEQARRRYPADYETAVGIIRAQNVSLADVVFYTVFGGLAVAFVELPNSPAPAIGGIGEVVLDGPADIPDNLYKSRA